MKRSRRRTSRATVAVLAVAILTTSICVIYKTRGKGAVSAPAMPALSALDVGAVSTTAQTRPAETAAIGTTLAPIETAMPDAPVAPDKPAAPAVGSFAAPVGIASAGPTTAPSDAVATKASWSQLLGGGTDGPTQVAPKTGPIVTGSGPLADGKARVAAGELIEARTGLNQAVVSGQLSDADAAAARGMISDINQTLFFSAKPLAGDPYTAAYLVKPGDSLAKIAAAHDSTWELLARINKLDPRRLRAGSIIKVVHGPIFAVVHKQAYLMDVYLGGLPGETNSMYLMSFPVGLGKGDSTPTGLWAIGVHAKLKHPTYYPPEGGTPIAADDPANPLGGYWIALTGVDGAAIGRTSYGIHGTIDPSSIGHQASMGCIRLKPADIAMVFDLLVEGKSRVLVD